MLTVTMTCAVWEREDLLLLPRRRPRRDELVAAQIYASNKYDGGGGGNGKTVYASRGINSRPVRVRKGTSNTARPPAAHLTTTVVPSRRLAAHDAAVSPIWPEYLLASGPDTTVLTNAYSWCIRLVQFYEYVYYNIENKWCLHVVKVKLYI